MCILDRSIDVTWNQLFNDLSTARILLFLKKSDPKEKLNLFISQFQVLLHEEDYIMQQYFLPPEFAQLANVNEIYKILQTDYKS